MTASSDLRRLMEVAELLLDHRLGQLRSSATDLERSRTQLDAVNQAARPAEGLSPMTAGKVEIAYDRWADVRRSELHLVIARQTVDWMEARTAAQDAFGRVQALQGLTTRLKDKR